MKQGHLSETSKIAIMIYPFFQQNYFKNKLYSTILGQFFWRSVMSNVQNPYDKRSLLQYSATKYPTAGFGPCYFTEMVKLNLKEVVVMMIKYHV
jgi:hypothetical protein